jgi:tyrosinase
MTAMMVGHMPNWGHLSAAFCPCHRVLLYHFESELRSIDSSVALSYWDWTDHESTSAVFSQELLGSNGRESDGQVMDGPFAYASGQWTVVVKDDQTNPDYLQRRFGADATALALPNKQRNPIMALSVYDEAPWYDSERRSTQQRAHVDELFRFRLEYDLHNLVHRYIGGDMALASSPNEPVFWLHHCNLDRLWSIWEGSAGTSSPYQPDHSWPDGQSGDKDLIFHFQNSAAPWIGHTTPRDVYESTRQLGVGYDTDAQERRPTFAGQITVQHQMGLPANEMYPLRKEFHDLTSSARMFPLRAEFKLTR